MREIADTVSHRAILIGMVFFTSGVIIGSIWANRAWGSYWSWDPKETTALATWVIFASWLFAKNVFKSGGKFLAVLSVAGFCAMMITWFGSSWFFSSLHQYK